MPLRIALHRFESDPSLPQRDGVNLAHTEITRLLATQTDPALDIRFHDFDRLLRSDAQAREALTGVDCLLCNVGPHAHYYHALRERLGLNFRIVRDIKTALWSSYLLQECLCAPLLRPGDALLATSHYSRVLVRHLFPYLCSHPVHLFEPVLAGFGEMPASVTPQLSCDDVITLGYVGRLSEDKNFPQVIDLLIALNREEPGRYRLVACGALHSASCAPERISGRLLAETGRDDLFRYLPPVPHEQVLPLLRGFDYFLFFSTSNLEVLGRVLIEAAAAGVPVLAANHAAASELLPSQSLLDVHYTANNPFLAHFDSPMGQVDLAQAQAALRRRVQLPPPDAPQVNRADRLTALLRDPRTPEDRAGGLDSLPPAQRRFVRRLHWDGMPDFASPAAALTAIACLQDWFCGLNGRNSPDVDTRFEELERRSRFPDRTRRFIDKHRQTRGDFTNLGGIDIELCNLVDFHPRFWLVADSAVGNDRDPTRPQQHDAHDLVV